MSAELTTDQVWQEIERHLFAVVGMVTPGGESRTAGVVYAVRDRRLYFVTDRDTWKVRHIARNPHVSITIPIDKRIPVAPWVKIPAATITFCGQARFMAPSEISEDLVHELLRGLETDSELLNNSCVIEVNPERDFVTYGVGVSLLTMRHPEEARGRTAV